MMKKSYLYPLLLLAVIGFGNHTGIAGDKDEIQAILDLPAAPEGVVFEILGSKDGLRWAIPRVEGYAQRLRQRFPGLAIAVVSHGREMFALQSSHQGEYRDVHKQVKSLVQEQSVQLHVCGTYAEWKGVSPEDFPDYVDVAAEGPAQIHTYQELGYRLVKLDRPAAK